MSGRSLPVGLTWLLVDVAIVAGILLLWTTFTAAHIDTAWEYERCLDAHTFGRFLDAVRHDNQPPLAPILNYAVVRAFSPSLDTHRFLIGMLNALVLLAFARGIGRPGGRGTVSAGLETLVPTRLGSSWYLFHPGVACVLVMTRYSSFIGVLWLPLYWYAVRATVDRDVRAAHLVGLLLGVMALLSYSALIPALAVGVCALAARRNINRSLVKAVLVGAAIPAVVLGCWLAYGGAEHLARVAGRPSGPGHLSMRNLTGFLYEGATWTLVGPCNLPTWIPIGLALAVGLTTLAAIRAPLRTSAPERIAFLSFVVLPIPLFVLIGVSAGYSFLGPTLIALSYPGTRPRGGVPRWHWPVRVGALCCATALTWAGEYVLRPTLYASKSREAVIAGILRAPEPKDVLFVEDWSARAYARELAPGRYAYLGTTSAEELRARVVRAKTVVAVRTDDNGAEDDWRRNADRVLTELGFQRETGVDLVGRYPQAALLRWLRMSEDLAQYEVIEYTLR